MQKGRGKEFETSFRQGLKQAKVCHDRLKDDQSGYAGTHNICDFSVFYNGKLYYFELKSRSSTSLGFIDGISKNQWSGLLDKSRYEGVYAGVLVWFVSLEKFVYVDIRTLNWLRIEGHKSLNLSTCKLLAEIGDIFIWDAVKKRTNFNHPMEFILPKLEVWYENGLKTI